MSIGTIRDRILPSDRNNLTVSIGLYKCRVIEKLQTCNGPSFLRDAARDAVRISKTICICKQINVHILVIITGN